MVDLRFLSRRATISREKPRSDRALTHFPPQATFGKPNTAGLDQEEVDILFDPTKSFRWIIARLSRRLKALDKVSSYPFFSHLVENWTAI
jgi:hypothetical protein